MSDQPGYPLFVVAGAVVIGVVIGATAFGNTSVKTKTKTKVVNQTVALYDIQDVDIDGRCYDSFGDSLGRARNVQSAINWKDEKQNLHGNIGHIILRNPLNEIDVDDVDCPSNATEMDLRINTVTYDYTVHQAGKVIDNGTATADVYHYIEAQRRPSMAGRGPS